MSFSNSLETANLLLIPSQSTNPVPVSFGFELENGSGIILLENDGILLLENQT